MPQATPRYEVIFAVQSVLAAEPRGTFSWSWIRIDADGLVSVRGKIHRTMRAAIDDAADHRREHGGGEIRVNLRDTPHEDSPNVTYLA
jgi:hypothetical protein